MTIFEKNDYSQEVPTILNSVEMRRHYSFEKLLEKKRRMRDLSGKIGREMNFLIHVYVFSEDV